MTVERHPIPAGLRLHPLRARVLTASDVGAAAGVDKFKSALDVQLEKMGLKPPQADNAAMRRGRLFEPAVEAYLRDELQGWRFLDPKVFLVDPELRLGATPDRLIEDPDEPGLINCQMKVVARPEFEKWNGEPPLAYQLQVTTESMLLDAHSGLLAVLVVSSYDAELELFTVPRHPAAEEKVREIAREFWARIERNELPKADYARDEEVLKKLYPPSKDVPVPLDLSTDNRIYDLLAMREALKGEIKSCEEQAKALDAEIVDKLKGAELAIADGWKITRRLQHRDAYTVPEADYAVLRVTRTGEAKEAA
jgi:predicted phage-related endonuclease